MSSHPPNLISAVRQRFADVCVAALLVGAVAAVYLLDNNWTADLTAKENSKGLLSPAVKTPERPDTELSETQVPREPMLGKEPKPTPDADTTPERATAAVPQVDKQSPSGLVETIPPQTGFPAANVSGPIPILGPPARAKKTEQVEFFKTRVYAKSVAFVVDCSGSMHGESFQRARAELARAIVKLQPGQSFCVVFFNHTLVPMLGNLSNPSLAEASPAVKTQVIAWMNSAHAAGGTNPGPALSYAVQLRPDVIYLLTDGQFSPLNSAMFDEFARHKIVVQTLGFGSSSDTINLRNIAARTGGTYRSITAADAASTLYLAPPQEVRAALDSARLEVRQSAIEAILDRELPYTDELFALLRDPDPPKRQAVHASLVAMAAGSDFGPTDGETEVERAEAIKRWGLWWKWRKQEGKQISSMLAANDVNECWVAAAITRQRALDLPDELLKVLGHPLVQIRREARAALVQLAGDADLGPDSDADEKQIAEAVARWNLWCVWKNAPETLAAKLDSDDANECWVAAALVRQLRLDLPDELISLLVHPSTHVRREVRAALVQLAGNVDFGPDAAADAAGIEEAADKWKEWRAERIVQAATALARQPGPDSPHDLIKLLDHKSVHVRRGARAALVQLVGDIDFGPESETDERQVAEAVARWNLWCVWKNAPETLAAKLDSDDANECWVATALVRQQRLDIPEQLIKILGHPSIQVRREVRAALVQLAGDVDFGPDAAADAAEVTESINKWNEWRVDRAKKAAAARLALQEAEATKKLKFAQQLFNLNRLDQARHRFEEIVKDYPDTQAAAKARKMLPP